MRLYFVDIAEFSSYLSMQVRNKTFNYKTLKVLSDTVLSHSSLFKQAKGEEKELCQEKLKELICLLREKAKDIPSNKESTKTHMIGTAQLLDAFNK